MTAQPSRKAMEVAREICNGIGSAPEERIAQALDAFAAEAVARERDLSKAIIHHMTLMVDDFGVHEPECVCSGDKTPHASDCKDCECGLREAVEFGVEQSYPLDPGPITPEEQARLDAIGKRAVAEALARAKALQP